MFNEGSIAVASIEGEVHWEAACLAPSDTNPFADRFSVPWTEMLDLQTIQSLHATISTDMIASQPPAH